MSDRLECWSGNRCRRDCVVACSAWEELRRIAEENKVVVVTAQQRYPMAGKPRPVEANEPIFIDHVSLIRRDP